MNSSDFPSVPQKVFSKEVVSISQEELSGALLSVLFAASVDETRPILTGVLFIFEKDKLTLVATDGFRLSQKKIGIKPSIKNQRVILPKGALLELARNIQGKEDLLFGFNQKDRQVIFGSEDLVFSS